MSSFQLLNVMDQQVPFDGIRMVEIDVASKVNRYVTAILVIGILWNDHDLTSRQLIDYFAYNSRFSRACSPCNSDYHHDFEKMVVRM